MSHMPGLGPTMNNKNSGGGLSPSGGRWTQHINNISHSSGGYIKTGRELCVQSWTGWERADSNRFRLTHPPPATKPALSRRGEEE